MLHTNLPGEHCVPSEFAAFGFSTVCQYVQNQSDVCDGGGYLLWTEFAFCASSSPADGVPLLRPLIVFASLLFFALLFVHLSTTADSFFCENIAAIVDIHHISQNIAGITFMAFGNGAPDIFSSIASVISSNQPRADLAISELLGGGIFVTTCVLGIIALTRPFHLMRRPILRDLFFYLAALGLLVVVTYCGQGQMEFWQPIAFMCLYLIYAATVVSTNMFRQHIRKLKRRRRMHRTIMRFSGLVPPKMATTSRNKVAPLAPEGLFCRAEKEPAEVEKQQKNPPPAGGRRSSGRFIVTPLGHNLEECGAKGAKRTQISTVVAMPGGTLMIPIQHNNSTGSDHHPHIEEYYSASDFLEAGKFFAKEELDELEETEGGRTEETTPGRTPTESTMTPTPMEEDSQLVAPSNREGDSVVRMLIRGMAPMDWVKFRRARWHIRAYMIAQIPSMLLLRATIPCASQPWSKPVSTLHAFLAPLVFCFAFQLFPIPLGNSPFILGHLGLGLSLLCSLFVLLFTRLDNEPRCYRRCSAYFGFCLSIAWIYATASEVMNVVLMLGTLSGISYQILGLTAIAWSNSIGDLVADFSVARQGMSRMAFSAAIGGPLFNLMVGFGATFMIAQFQGKFVTIRPNPVTLVMFVFLGLSLLITFGLLLLQKFYVRRFHGLTLFALYICFLAFAISASQGILPFL